MYGDLETMKAYWKETETDRTAADKKVCNGPAYLYAAHLTANATGASTAVIRDGHDANGDIKVDLAALTSSKDNRNFDPPIFFKKGIFIDVGDNVTSVIVHFLPRGQKDGQG
jgi:hypothetical protein